MSVAEQIRPALGAALTPLGLRMEDLSVVPAGRRRLVRVWVDRAVDDAGPDSTEPVEPLSLDEVADATRAVSDALDDDDAMGEQPYTLEVTSPGIDRPLTAPRHFRRNLGRLVTFTREEGEPVTGRIVRAGEHEVTVEVPAARREPARTVQLPYAGLARAVVQVEFSRSGPADADAAEEG